MGKTRKRLIAKVKTNKGSFGAPVNTDISAVYEKLRSGDNADRVKKMAIIYEMAQNCSNGL